MEVKRCFDILGYQLEKFEQDVALAKKENGKWITYSTRDTIRIVNELSIGMKKLGIKKDDKVALISFNRPEWNFIDYAVQQLGAVLVPMYPTITVEDYRYIFQDAGVKMVFVSDKELCDKVHEAIKDIQGIEHVYCLDTIEGENYWEDVRKLGEGEDPQQIETDKAAVNSEDLLTLIYTSGTTGKPKGVMLTHSNLISNIVACFPLMPVGKDDRALSFLPLCHVYERMKVFLYMYTGISVYYAESLDTIGENLKEVKPHIFTTVPRLLEKVYEKIYAKGLELKGLKRLLFFWALNLGLKFELGKNQGWWYNFQLNLANKIIFNKWREALGNNIKAVVSGSAALQPRLAKVFWAARIPVMQGYGLTETSPVISVNRVDPKLNRIGTVGPVIDGVEVKIAEDGEILTRGPHVMKGYYKKPEATAEMIDKDGWLHTGDIGEFEESIFLKITGRKKEIFKTSGGKYIAPELMENKFKESMLIEQMMVIGEGEKFPSAIIVPSFSSLKEWCEIKSIAYTTDAEMIAHPEVLDKFIREVDKYNESFAQYEKIKKFKLLPRLFTIEDGELTPTMKMKRSVIMKKYADLVNEIYTADNN